MRIAASTGSTPVVAVLGATGSIGRELVRRFLGAGFKVALIARSQEALLTTQLRLDPDGRMTRSFSADATDQSQLCRCLDAARHHLGRLDAIIHSVGFPPDPEIPLAEYPVDSWLKTMATYTTGVFLCFREACRVLNRGGHIVVISSAVTRFPESALPPLYLGHYAAAKAAVDELCKWARREAHDRGLLLSRVAPSAVDTPFHRGALSLGRPMALVPLDLLTDTIIAAVRSGHEIDEEMVPRLSHRACAP